MRRILIGAVVVLGVAGTAVYALRPAPKDPPGPCPEAQAAIAGIRREPVLRQAPAGAELGAVELSGDCEVVSRRVGGPPAAAYYHDLAERTGWQPNPLAGNGFTATKATGDGCPWWLVVGPAGDGLLVQVHQKALPPSGPCLWSRAGRLGG